MIMIATYHDAVDSVLLYRSEVTSSPSQFFQLIFNAIIILSLMICVGLNYSHPEPKNISETRTSKSKQQNTSSDDKGARAIQLRFLPVFYLVRCADWLQGPYFYEVYSSKHINGVPVSAELVSRLFLVGFASTALFGPLVGKLSDKHGRKKATVAFTVLNGIAACSTRSNVLLLLFIGRIIGGIGTSLLTSAPEAWLVGEAHRNGKEDHLEEIFGRAYSGDSIVAIMAGQLAAIAASQRGTNGPFELSVVCLGVAAILTCTLWDENVATSSSTISSCESVSKRQGGLKDTERVSKFQEAMVLIKSDSKILLTGAVQCLFEAAMYIFVLQWPPAVNSAVKIMFGEHNADGTPYGTIFSCFMACCLVGSTVFGKMSRQHKISISGEKTTGVMLFLATFAMDGAVASSHVANPLMVLLPAFFLFESCVGFYFPSIGTLRSKYVPDSHRSVIINIFGVPLNVLVVGVFLSIQSIGVNGALGVAAVSLGLATTCMMQLGRIAKIPGIVERSKYSKSAIDKKKE